MSYDNWKTTDPSDRYRLPEPPCVKRPRYDDDDVCLYCGANPTQACQFYKENQP